MDDAFRANPGEIACVILEPATFDAPAAGYLEGIKELCTREGALLVFDEIVTGFRVAIGGAQQLSGVIPDLACFGKAMANGFPLSAIVGRADVMRWFEKVFFSFTFGGEAVSLAAIAVLFWLYAGRQNHSDLVRQVSWILAVSQLLVLCVPIALAIVTAFAIGVVAILAIAALIFLFTERP